jgi:XTP/dITP diphosphohydrolase
MPHWVAEPALLLATRSPDKAREIREIIDGTLRTPLLSLDEAGIPPAPDEDDIEKFETFAENAAAKAAYFCQRSGMPTLADDSGISIAALGGAPGVRSRRFAGRNDLQGAALDHVNNALVLARLEGRDDAERAAHYVCAAAFAKPHAATAIALAAVSGRITTTPRGNGGFGYDPLFLLPQLDRTFAQLDAPTKHAFSHRGRAFRALAPLLRHQG